jgi:predicted AlkP superfamily phosphohydrolase/phosphomutase
MLLALPVPAAAYVGPGPGFVVLTSFLAVFVAGVLALFAVLTWPFRAALMFLRRLGRPKPRVRRLVVVGFDGQDPRITERLMGAGRLPNFQRLAEQGGWTRLNSTFPSVSPVAWSSFSTGTHPAKHGIYDFLDRDRKSYMPVLSSTRIGNVERTLKLGRYRIPLRKPELKLLRGSRPFWSVLGEAGIWSTILRVPVTFPPDRFRGAQLSAMCVPDLLGSQGTFTLFTTRPAGEVHKEGGRRVALQPAPPAVNGGGARYTAVMEGPPNELLAGAPVLALSLALEIEDGGARAVVKLGGEQRGLAVGEMSDWVPLSFPAAPGIEVKGICRIMPTELAEHVSLYVTPLHLDPDRPAMPISHPPYYATYLSRKLGRFATLGLAEDTWALNEGVIRGSAFLEQTYAIDGEREAMLLDGLETVRRGAVVCVFDATDRIQHMFWRQMEEGDGEHARTIEQLYQRNDAILGRVMRRIGDDEALVVLSDHGFSSFRRGVNLNAWLLQEGYLALLPERDGTTEWLRDVDWSRTRAYALGLTGVFLNVRGREAKGIVDPEGEAAELRAEIAQRLGGLLDPEAGQVAIREAFDPVALYSGPYLERAPDLIVGYDAGYRASWDGATGVVSGPVFDDNAKAWSGDHCIDPRLVPGILFCNRPVRRAEPSLVDIAPSALWLFGVEPPAYMDGHVLFDEADFGGPS